jgi:hypothetical protein
MKEADTGLVRYRGSPIPKDELHIHRAWYRQAKTWQRYRPADTRTTEELGRALVASLQA